MDRIFASGAFDASPRSRAFLTFIVQETLAGRQEALTQAAIATRVFARRDDFDPTVDPIVRIQAGRLRRSLERYYLLAGRSDALRIELPRGTYVPVLRWATPDEGRTRRGDSGRAAAGHDGWPSIVLGAFESLRPDPALDAAAAEIQEQLALELGRYGDVRVVLPPEPDRPGPDGSRRFDLSGRLSRDAAGPRLTAQLVDRGSAGQIWAEDYRAVPGSAAAFYEETARVIAARVASEQGVIVQHLWAVHRKRPPAEPTPYDAILRSYQYFFNRDPADLPPAVDWLRQAVGAVPECTMAWVQLARLYCANHVFEIAPIDTPIDQAVVQAQNGVRLNPSSQRARAALAFALFLKGELAASRAEAQRALALNPESLVYLENLGWLLTMLGDFEQGPGLVRKAIARNPHHLPIVFHALWLDHLRRGEFDEAYQAALQWSDGTFFWRALIRACSLGHLGRLPEARHEVAELLAAKPDFARRGRVLIGRLIRFPDVLERVVDGLAKAGLELD